MTFSRVAGLVFLAVVAFHLVTLMRAPPVHVDEAWFAARAAGYNQTGEAFGELDRSVFDLYPGHWNFFPRFPVVLHAWSLRFVDEPSVVPMRLVSLFFGLWLLAAVYFVAAVLGDRWHGLASVVLVSFSVPFLFSAHAARTDAWAAAFGFTAIALYLHPRTRRWVWMFVAGVLVGLAFEAHPNSAIFGPTLVALFWFDQRLGLLKSARFWAYVGGVIVGLGYYLATHVLPDPSAYLALQELAFGATHTPPILTLDPVVVARSFVDLAGVLLFRDYLFLLPLIVIAVVLTIKNRATGDVRRAQLVAVLLVFFAIWVRNKINYYSIEFSPAIDILIAGFVVESVRGAGATMMKRVAIGVFLVIALTIRQGPVVANSYAEYKSVQEQINTVVPPGSIIVGPQTWWLGLQDHTYVAWEHLVYFRRHAPDSSLEEAFRNTYPDILIVDSQLEQYILERGSETRPWRSTYYQHLSLVREDLNEILDTHGTLVGDLETDTPWGHIRIYHLHW